MNIRKYGLKAQLILTQWQRPGASPQCNQNRAESPTNFSPAATPWEMAATPGGISATPWGIMETPRICCQRPGKNMNIRKYGLKAQLILTQWQRLGASPQCNQNRAESPTNFSPAATPWEMAATPGGISATPWGIMETPRICCQHPGKNMNIRKYGLKAQLILTQWQRLGASPQCNQKRAESPTNFSPAATPWGISATPWGISATPGDIMPTPGIC
ncbi:hypothetical protein DFO77_12257 [Marinilabilia salmonicolor]|uniref:Uncharacterized protein n=1 Tax=Marinilabilia salmonicolor TaxID=989 RepID=A0A368UNN5_9BACT|nr:hypothetical protein DFO77_12257 [Marinilabilia salmonicolor]